jgi:hypothetical protein
MKLYQPVYLDSNENIISISMNAFTTNKEAKNYGTFVCKRGEHVQVIEIEVIK